MPSVLICPELLLHQPEAPYVKSLEAAGFEVLYPDDPTFTRGLKSEAETIEQLSICDAVIAGGEYFTPEVVGSLPRLRVIARAGVGHDRVHLEAATEAGVVLTITPTANHEAVAELALALLLGVAKSISFNDRAVRAGEWPIQLTQPIRGTTCGVLGLGRIGRSMAVRCQALGMKVIATETYPDESFVSQHGIELVSFDELLSRSDYVSIHCPLNSETEGLFNKATFARMKAGSVLVNTARGKMVVEKDLVEALQSGHLRGAGLDVYEVEPPNAQDALFGLENVVLTPHVAGGDARSQLDMGIEAADCIIRLQRGEWPHHAIVNRELGPDWSWATD